MNRFFLKVATFLLAGCYASISNASTVSLSVGQQTITSFVLPNGVPLKIRLVALPGSGGYYYEPASINYDSPASSVRGMLEWMNVFSIDAVDSANLTGLVNSTAIDYRISPDDPYGRSSVRYKMRVSGYPGAALTLDNVSGEVKSLSGYSHPALKAAYSKNAMWGGYWRATNIVFKLSPILSVVGDLTGAKDALGSVQSQAIASKAGVELWTVDSLVGPSEIPFAGLVAAASVNDLPAVLQNAGFKVVSTTPSEIVFSVNYKFVDLRATSDLLDFACVAWGCTPTVKNAFGNSVNKYVGKFFAPVQLSIPLVP